MDLDFIKRQLDIITSVNAKYLDENTTLQEVVKYLDQLTSLDELKSFRSMIFEELSILDEINAYLVEDGQITEKEKVQSKELVKKVNEASLIWFESLK
jgi:hypothetical protein